MAIQFNYMDYRDELDDPYLKDLITELQDIKNSQTDVISIAEVLYQKRRNGIDYNKDLDQLIYELIGRQ
jgi:hypothetical protein